MVHPAYEPGAPGEPVKDPRGFTWNPNGRSVRFPPVQVVNASQEEYYWAQGFRPSGNADHAAFARSLRAAPAPEPEPQLSFDL